VPAGRGEMGHRPYAKEEKLAKLELYVIISKKF